MGAGSAPGEPHPHPVQCTKGSCLETATPAREAPRREGVTPRACSAPRCSSGPADRKAWIVWSSPPLPAPVPGGSGAPAGKERARRRFGARWHCHRSGTRGPASTLSARGGERRRGEVAARTRVLRSAPSAHGKSGCPECLPGTPQLHVRSAPGPEKETSRGLEAAAPHPGRTLGKERAAALRRRRTRSPTRPPLPGPWPGPRRSGRLRVALSPPLLQLSPPGKRAHTRNLASHPGRGRLRLCSGWRSSAEGPRSSGLTGAGVGGGR